MSRNSVPPDALEALAQANAKRVKVGEITTMAQLLATFTQKEFLSLTHIDARRLRVLREDWSKTKPLERAKLRNGLCLNSRELEKLLK